VIVWEFQADERAFVHANRYKLGRVADRERKGVEVSTLFKDECEEVRFEQWSAHTDVTIDAPGGAEILVLEGSFNEGGDRLRKYSWLRMPVDSVIRAQTEDEGAFVWIKTGHLSAMQTVTSG